MKKVKPSMKKEKPILGARKAESGNKKDWGA